MKPRTKDMLKDGETGYASTSLHMIVNVVEQLPVEQQQEVRSYAEYLLAMRPHKQHGKMTLKWAGGLRDFRNRFTALGLQKKSLDWWRT